MCACVVPCAIEHATSGPPSPGPIHDNERVVRAAYSPMHYKGKSRQIKPSVIRRKDLAEGSLSVWRIDAVKAFNLEDAVKQLNQVAPQDNALGDVIELNVIDVRRIKTQSSMRALCVNDDTVCGRGEEMHEAHATIGVCDRLSPQYRDINSIDFTFIFDCLVHYVINQQNLNGVTIDPLTS